MKRYYVFMGADYYPIGGMEDFLKDFDSIDKAKIFIHLHSKKDFNGYESEKEQLEYFWEYNWAHIWDSKERKIIWEKEKTH